MSVVSSGPSSEALRVAVVGAGPAGFYASDFLLHHGAHVDLFERLPAPFGLLRYGVAPDHQKIKRLGVAFEKIAHAPELRFFGNVEFGRDISLPELLGDYDQVLFAVGAATDRRLGIPGEDLEGSVAATSLVGWYNAHPDHSRDRFDLSTERAVIVGVGNVALDVARILLRDPSELATSDIADYALTALEQSSVREVVLLGRRAPEHAAFDAAELIEIAELPGVEVVLENEVSPPSDPHLQLHIRKNLEFMAALPRHSSGRAERCLRLRFLAAPKALIGSEGRVQAVEIGRNLLVPKHDGSEALVASDEPSSILPTGLVVRSVGYRSRALPGLPFDERASLVPSHGGRVGPPGERLERCYVVGWIKRGPVGLLGANKVDAHETVDHMLEDREEALASREQRRPGSVVRLLAERGVRSVSYAEWERLDALERSRGAARGKLREKLATIPEALEVLARCSPTDSVPHSPV